MSGFPEESKSGANQPEICPDFGGPKCEQRKAALTLEAILAQHSEAMTKRLVALAVSGEPRALEICLNRLLPRRREAPLEIDLPQVESVEDAELASSAILAAIARGKLAPSEGQCMMTALLGHLSIIEMRGQQGRKLELARNIG